MVIVMDAMIIGILIFWGLALWIISGLRGWVRS
jgi:hypothetical protein